MAETQQTKTEEQEDHSNGWLGDFVRLTIMIWAMGVITANYLGIFSQAVDPTFPASLLTGTAATYTPALGKIGKKKKEENGVNVDNSNSRSGIK